MTADLAMGANTAIESAITLCNLLHHAVTSPSPQSDLSQPLSSQSLTSLFTQYQTTRHPRAQSFVQLSGEVTRMRTYDTPWKKFFISHIAPWLENVQVKQFAASLRETPKLDYVDVRTINEGAVGWKAEEKAGGGTRWSWWMASAVMAVGVGVAYVVGARRL
jgi:FAD dependent monooxygenase